MRERGITKKRNGRRKNVSDRGQNGSDERDKVERVREEE